LSILDILGYVAGAAKTVVVRLHDRFGRKPRLWATLPKQPIASCLVGRDELYVGTVPHVIAGPEAPPEAEGFQSLQCLCLHVHNHGWDQEAANCYAKLTLQGYPGSIPITCYWATKNSADAEYATIPHKDFRRLLICLIDPATLESIFCTWVFPRAGSATSPWWQLRIPLGYAIHARMEVTADNARTLYGDIRLEITRTPPFRVAQVTWKLSREPFR
jgi:hypothetical protein